MKILIITLLLTIEIFLKFGELNAADNAESSSSSGKRRGGPRPGAGRPHGKTVAPFHPGEKRFAPLERPFDRKINYMTHDVFLWLAGNETVVQASFEGMELPFHANFYKYRNFLVRLAPIGGFKTVIYVTEKGSLMGVRAPKPKTADIMEPSDTEWFIVYGGQYYRLRLTPGPFDSRPTHIALAKGNVRPREPNDLLERVVFPFQITFCTYRAKPKTKALGAFIPQLRLDDLIGC